MKVTRKDILFLSISVFFVTVVWIASNLYHAFATSTISDDLQMQIVPINPNFDTEVIDKLRSRNKVNPLTDLQLSTKVSPVSPGNSSSTSGGLQGQ